MPWQCPLDGSANTGLSCAVCGSPRVRQVPRLREAAGQFVLDVPMDGLIIGVENLQATGVPGISRAHARVFVDEGSGAWVIVRLSRFGPVEVGRVEIAEGTRHALIAGDEIVVARHRRLLVEMRAITGPLA